MSKFLSGRVNKILVGILGYTENKTVVQTTGKVGIGTTDAQQNSLYVVGDTNITGDTNVGGALTASQATVSDLTDNRIVVAGTAGRLEDSAGLTFDGSTLTVDGDLQVAGVLSYDDVTNVDSLGIVTARKGLHVLSNGVDVTGVSTFSDDVDLVGNPTGIAQTSIQFHKGDGTGSDLDALNFYDRAVINLGVGHTGYLSIGGHYAGGSFLLGYGSHLAIDGSSLNSTKLKLRTNDVRDGIVVNPGGGSNSGAVELYHSPAANVASNKRFETTGYGATVYNDLRVGTAVTVYGNSGIVSAISFYGDGTNLTNTGATLNAVSGTERLVTTQLTSGTMVDAATDADLTFRASDNLLSTPNIAISGGISTDGYDTGNQFELMRADGNGGWAWASVPGIFSVNNILNGFNVREEGLIVGTAGSIHTLDFHGLNVTASADPQPNGIATVTMSPTPTFDETYVVGVTSTNNLRVTGVSTFVGNINASGDLIIDGNVSIGGTLTYEDVKNVDSIGIITARNGLHVLSDGVNIAGLSTFTGRIVGAATSNVIPFLYANLSDLPSAVTYHGAFAHVHATGRAYYAHAANWYELVNKELNGDLIVGTGITMYANTGIISATAFYGDGSNLTNTGATLTAASGTQRLVLTGLTSGTMVDAATDSDLAYNASDDRLIVANLDISGITTLGGPVTAGSSEGVVGQYLRNVGTGVTWANFPTLRTTQTNTANAGQTTFNFTYNTNFLDVFVNGVKLSPSEYTATNGSQIILNTAAFAGEIVEFHSYNTTSTYGGGGGGGGISLTDLSVTTANSPLQLGALAYNNSNGVFTFTPPDVQGQSRQALSVGTPNNPLQVGAISYNNGTGVFTYTPPDLSSYVQTNSSASFSGIDVTGHTETDTLRVSGVSTFSGASNFNNTIKLADNVVAEFGAGADGRISYTSSTNRFYVRVPGGSGSLILGAGPAVRITNENGLTDRAVFTSSGATITGSVTATSFSGSGSSLTGLTGASAATYGNGTAVPQITVDANGRITGITNVSISGGGGGGGTSMFIRDSGSLVGAAGTIDFGTGLSVSPVSAGIVTVTSGSGISTAIINADTLNVVGVSTLGDLKFDAAGAHIEFTPSSYSGSAPYMEFWVGNNSGTHYAQIDGGNAGQLQILNTGHPNGEIDIRAKSGLSAQLDGYYTILAQASGGVKLYHPGSQGNILSQKFETLGAGVTVTGTTFSNQLSISGVSTFTNTVNLNDGATIPAGDSLDFGTDFSISRFSNQNKARIQYTGPGDFTFEIDDVDFRNSANNETLMTLRNGGGVSLYHNNNIKLSSTSTGISISGNIDTVTDISCNSIANNAGGGATWVLNNTGNATFTGTVTANTFSGSGASLTNLPAANLTGTLPAISGANLTNLPAPTPADTDVQVTFDVSSNGSSAYRFTGPGNSGSDDNPDIYLIRGQRYRFINTTGSGHPFRIQSDTSGTAYTDGVSGSQSGTQDFNVQHDAPTHLYYQCTIHSGMIGNIYIVGRSDGRLGIQGASSSFTLAANHAGKLVRSTGNGSTLTIPQSTFTPGDMISIFNVSTGNNTIAQGSGVTLYNTADGTTGNRTLGAKGVCTIVCSASNEFIISGSGLS